MWHEQRGDEVANPYSWCRKSAFSASSSDFPLARSVSVPSKSEVVGGLIQRKNRAWSV